LLRKEESTLSFVLSSSSVLNLNASIINKKMGLINFEKNKILQLEGIIDKNGKPTLCGILNYHFQYIDYNLYELKHSKQSLLKLSMDIHLYLLVFQ